MSIEYSKVGDYLFPNFKSEGNIQLSKYGRMKLHYLKNHQRGLYHKLLTSNELNEYLLLIDKEANEMYDRMIIELKKQRNITEELKEKNQMLWVKAMNNISDCVDEIIRKEIIYQ